MLEARSLMVVVLGLGLLPLLAPAQEEQEARIAELEQKVAALSQAQEQALFGEIYLPPGESVHGLSPGASKVYRKEQGLSIGGYGEALYQNFQGNKTDEADFLRAILYLGYKFNDHWVLNTEFEFEHASTSKEGSTSVEFAYLDYLARPEFNLRAGLLLIPVGVINELHEPTTFFGARRPDIESRIIPSTWRENGAGIFGEIQALSYKAYLVTGLKAEGFSSSGLRGGRQKGSKAKANDWAGVLRLDWRPAPRFSMGGSAYHGDSGQDIGLDVTTTLVEGHAEYKWRGLQLRALAVHAELDDVAELNRLQADPGAADADMSSVGETLTGWYAEAGYNLLNEFNTGETQLVPFVRYEDYNTQDAVPAGFSEDAAADVEVLTVGLNFKPLDELVLKADYQFYDNAAGTKDDQFNLSMGYVF